MAKPIVKFVLGGQPGDLSLAQVFCGAAGTVALGEHGVHLWQPGQTVPEGAELVYDLRGSAVEAADLDAFKAACTGHFMTAFVGLLDTDRQDAVEAARQLFDYVLIPSRKLQNSPADLRAHVLGYWAENKA